MLSNWGTHGQEEQICLLSICSTLAQYQSSVFPHESSFLWKVECENNFRIRNLQCTGDVIVFRQSLRLVLCDQSPLREEYVDVGVSEGFDTCARKLCSGTIILRMDLAFPVVVARTEARVLHLLTRFPF